MGSLPRQRQRRVSARPSGDARLQTVLASLAHEVRTPLNGILVLADLLAVSDLPARERDWARTIKRAAEHLASLTTLVVDGVRAGTGKLTPKRESFDPAVLAAELGRSLVARAGVKGLTARVQIDEALPAEAIGDAVLLRAIVENLLDNAVKFTERGEISLTVDVIEVDDLACRLAFTVADQGIGIAPSDLVQLFRPFEQANRDVGVRFGGAGLGLAFARDVARAMGGDLTASSAPDTGSSFRCEIAVEIAQSRAPEGTTALRSLERATVRRLRILCVEDNPYGRVMLDTMITALGHAVDFVTTGEAAITAAEAQRYDLILMDVTLPGMGGIEAAQRIRALTSPASLTPIVGISGRGEASEEQAARAAGMAAYLIKPISPTALATAMAVANPDRSAASAEP